MVVTGVKNSDSITNLLPKVSSKAALAKDETTAGARYLSRNANIVSQSTQQEKTDENIKAPPKLSHYQRNKRGYSPKNREGRSVNITNISSE